MLSQEEMYILFAVCNRNYSDWLGDLPETVCRLRHLCLRPVDKIKMLCGTGKGGVDPVDVVGREHLIGHVALVEIDVCPLPALCLVAGDGVAELHLQGVVVSVLTDFLHAVGLQRYVGIVLQHIPEELLVLFMTVISSS